jgi:replication factor C small subunit
MESFSMSCRFILSCNYSSKIIEPIQSRCAVYRFKPLGETELSAQLRYIATKEQLEISDEALGAISYVAAGDLRRAINTLQSAASIKTEIDQETIYQITATPDPQAIKDLLYASIGGKLKLALSLLDALLLEQGFSGSEIVVQIHKALLDLDISDQTKVQLINSVGEIDFRLSEGADERIQLEALIAEFVLLSQRNQRTST